MQQFLALLEQSNHNFAQYIRDLGARGGIINQYDGTLLGGAYDTAPGARGSNGVIPAIQVYRFDLGKKMTVDEWALVNIYQIEDQLTLTNSMTQDRIITPTGDLVLLKYEREWQVGQSNVVIYALWGYPATMVLNRVLRTPSKKLL